MMDSQNSKALDIKAKFKGEHWCKTKLKEGKEWAKRNIFV